MSEHPYELKDPKAFHELVELYRGMTASQRVARIFELNEAQEVRDRESVRSMYPEAGEREVFLRVASRRLDRETMIKVYGWDPDLHP
jgi:hypothetical protein